MALGQKKAGMKAERPQDSANQPAKKKLKKETDPAVAPLAGGLAQSSKVMKGIFNKGYSICSHPHPTFDEVSCFGFSEATQILCVGRQSGALEFYQVSRQGLLFKEAISGRDTHTVRSCLWVGSRFFTTHLSNNVVEWDLVTLTPKDIVTNSYGGVIWDMKKHPSLPLVVVCCEDGHARLFDVPAKGPWQLRLTLPKRADEVALCCNFSVTLDGALVLVGTKKGSITAYNWANKAELWSNSVKGHVWSVGQVDERTVACGSSEGKLYFIDMKTGVSQRSLWTHRADILTMAVAYTEGIMFVSGCENRLIRLSKDGKSNRWNINMKEGIHLCDVKAMAMVSDSEGRRMLVTGGADGDLYMWVNVLGGGIVRPTKTLQNIRPVPSLGHMSGVHGKYDFAAAHSGRKMSIWAIPVDGEEALAFGPQSLFDYELKGRNHIVCCAISPQGKLFACSTGETSSLFTVPIEEQEWGSADMSAITPKKETGTIRPSVQRKAQSSLTPVEPELHPQNAALLKIGCIRLMAFVPSKKGDATQMAIVDNSNQLWIVDLESGATSNCYPDGFFDHAITMLQVSSCGKFVMVGNRFGAVSVMQIVDGKLQMWFNLPVVSKHVSAAGFMGTTEEGLCILVAYVEQTDKGLRNELALYSVTQRKMSPWTVAATEKFEWPATFAEWRPNRMILDIAGHPHLDDIVALHSASSSWVLKVGGNGTGDTKGVFDTAGTLKASSGCSMVQVGTNQVIPTEPTIAAIQWHSKGTLMIMEIKSGEQLRNIPPALMIKKYAS